MAYVFVHGVPDTGALWSPLLQELSLPEADTQVLELPAFGAARPPGFAATMDGYAAFVVDQIEKVATNSGPVKVIGHDWGGLLTLQAAHLRPDLIESWVVSAGVVSPGDGWHGIARKWQTPIVGELFMLGMSGRRKIDGLVSATMPRDLAELEAPHIDGDMKRAILSLYRSAKTVSADWGPNFATLKPPGLMIWGAADRFVSARRAGLFADRHGYPLHIIENAAHWVPWEQPKAFADHVKAFWGTAA